MAADASGAGPGRPIDWAGWWWWRGGGWFDNANELDAATRLAYRGHLRAVVQQVMADIEQHRSAL